MVGLGTAVTRAASSGRDSAERSGEAVHPPAGPKPEDSAMGAGEKAAA